MSDTSKTDSLPWYTCQTKELDWVRCIKREDCREIERKLIATEKERDELLKACQDLKAKSVVDAILYERKIDALAKIVVKCRNSNRKQWKPVTRGGADSYLGLPPIMREIDTVLVQTYGTSDLSNIPELRKALYRNDGKE